MTGEFFFSGTPAAIAFDVVTVAWAVFEGVIALAIRIRAEEKQLTQALGQDYEAFAATHKRLIPGIL